MNHIAFADVEPELQKRITQLGGNPSLNLYRILANHPTFLSAWIDFAYSLRKNCTVPRDVRELMILRGAQMVECDYEWLHHATMARAAGVPEVKISGVASWRTSSLYSEVERTCLQFMEAVVRNEPVSEELDATITQHFTPPERIELALTASFYAMVPRVLKSLRVPVDAFVASP